MDITLEIIGTIVGLIYLWQEYNASINLWITSIIMPAIYLFIYYNAGLYADFGINIYYLLIAIYGWASWKYGFELFSSNRKQQELTIGHIPYKSGIWLSMLFFVTWALITWILITFTDSNVPYSDAFTTALSIIGMYMLARKYIEQWMVWIIVDVVCVGLYIYKELYFTSALYAVYAIIAIFGYRKWATMIATKN